MSRKLKAAMRHVKRVDAGKKLHKSRKFKVVMDEYARGTLKSGSGEKVKDQKQALAIAYSESRKAKSKKKG